MTRRIGGAAALAIAWGLAGCGSPPAATSAPGPTVAEPAPDATASAAAGAAATDRSQEIAAGVYLVPGVFVPGRQPDGNSVIFSAPAGAVVVDTGRHPQHTQAVLDQIAALGLVPRAVVNTHWHLDHVGGNVLFRQRHPDVRIYASDAIAEARTGFLANYHQQLETMLAGAQPGSAAQEGFRRELALIDAADQLAPDEVIAASGPRVLAGRPLELHLERRAVTAGDVWVLDPATHVLVAGDLVTLPAPFLDTACPAGWQAALAHLEQADWQLLVPGHGHPLSRDDFATYRKAFDALLACAASTRPASECVDAWFGAGGELFASNDPGNGREMVTYYVGQVLRGDPARIAKLCSP
ncbi:MAG TPA: MBL fold metallo-hydrolase [Thermoanaerobaculia bacterium]|nr:MBL fold metallo-hydrolase [Thermoanaerobaculia bacterium]